MNVMNRYGLTSVAIILIQNVAFTIATVPVQRRHEPFQTADDLICAVCADAYSDFLPQRRTLKFASRCNVLYNLRIRGCRDGY